MEIKETYYKNLSQTIIKNLEKRHMTGYYFPTAAKAVEKAMSLIEPKATVAFGGSVTLTQSKMIDALQCADITLIDRNTAKTPEEVTALYHKAYTADYYFMSTNAITKDGILVNIDGVGNRVGALIYGPTNVIIIAGMNKVVASTEEALSRARNIAAPPNCNRLNRNTPCASTGFCSDCLSTDCVCSQTVITRNSIQPGRITVILVGDTLGF